MEINQKMKADLFATLIASASAIESDQRHVGSKNCRESLCLSSSFAPWCGHCKRMKPAWDSSDGVNTKGHEKMLVIADVDCIEGGKSLCDEDGVKGLPDDQVR